MLLCTPVLADVYMHNPRGSNDRNCERNVNRNNGNRLFDSQNNAKGGYACPRAVGDEIVQDEDGVASTGPYEQNKKLYFYEGSYLPIEWTNQHGCGQNSKVNCEIVLQYMCEDTADPQVDNFWPFTNNKNNDDNVGDQVFRSGGYIASPRDGIPINDDDAATDTIPDTLDAAIPDNANDRRYGMHESYDFYQLCQRTERNKGLYTADQRMRREDQRGTRQNPNGNRRGLECPEERDYYPWWHPSPWVDIAVLTNDAGDTPCKTPEECATTRCKFYLEESFNKNVKGYCDVDHANGDVSSKTSSSRWNQRKWYNNRDDCEDNGFTWYEKALSDVINVSYPVCAKTAFARVNQLGNSFDQTVNGTNDAPYGVNANRYLWKVPSIPEVVAGDADAYFEGHDGNNMEDAYLSCTLRLRYNISTSDFPAWPNDATELTHPWYGLMVDSRNNSLSVDDTANTPLTQDPYIYTGAGDDADVGEQFVSLAVNTNQYARTFQDRSYKFAIKPRPTSVTSTNDNKDDPYIPVIPDGARVYNVNVRGKRGNIVQTYPAVEYDFVPNSLAVDRGDYIHFQWQGSDYNPRRGCNDAEGGPPDPNNFISSDANNARADRSNLIFMDTMAENVPMDMLGYTAATTNDDDNPSGLAFSEKKASMKATLVNSTPCFNFEEDSQCFEQVVRLAYLNQQSDGGSLALRRGRDCLTQDELDAISNKQERENHPLNCAKMNAKPYPYFDGGVMKADNPGKFAYFSSRNNNFSNRDQTGVVCVRGTTYKGKDEKCEVDTDTGVLQDTNYAISTSTQRYESRLKKLEAASDCDDEANSNGAANDQGASSCISASASGSDVLTVATFTTEQAANDAMGDGDKESCEVISWFEDASNVEKYLSLAVGLLFTGLGAAYLSVYVYNRRKRQERLASEHQFSNQQKRAWKDNNDANLI